jgi:hypothetical protein
MSLILLYSRETTNDDEATQAATVKVTAMPMTATVLATTTVKSR